MKAKMVRVTVLMALVLTTVVMLSPLPALAATCTSTKTGNWNDTTVWSCAAVPGSGDDVYIESVHIVTLARNESVKDLHLNSTSAQRLVTGSFTLSIYGKLRAYSGAAPGANATPPSSATWIDTSGGGKISIVGDSRNITNSAEWAANNTSWTLEIAMNAGQTATMGTSIKAGSWNIVSGILDASTYRIAADNGTTGQGDITIASGATVRSAATSTGTSAVFGRTGTTRSGTLTVNGLLVLNGASPAIAMNAINFNGTVEYGRSGVQTLAVAINTGANPSTYANLKLSGSGTKTLGLNTTVNGTLTLADTANLALSTFTLTYGGSSTLEYAGSGAQTTANAEFPATGGPNSLTINNSNGVTLNGDKTVTNTLTLTSGDLNTGANTLTLTATGSSVTGTGDVVGNVRRAGAFNTSTDYRFNNANTLINFGSVTNGGSPSVVINLSKSAPAGLTTAVSRVYSITPADISAYDATLRLGYKDTETGGMTEANLRAWRYNGSRWVLQTGGVDTTNNFVYASNVAAFSNWAITDNGGPTAVTLSSFDARADAPDALPLIGLGALGLGLPGAAIAGIWLTRRRWSSG